MKEYAINFGYIDGENKSSIEKKELMIFPTIYNRILKDDASKEKISPTLSLNSFVQLLVHDGWVGLHDDNAVTKEKSTFRLYSKKYNTQLLISISNDKVFNRNYQMYISDGIGILRKITGNNLTYFNNGLNQNTDNNHYPKIVVDNTVKTKVKVYINSVKKLFKEKPKLAIALCTLTVAVTVAAGGFVIKTVVDRVETQKLLDEYKKYSYQVNQTLDATSHNENFLQAEKNGNVDNSLANPNGQLEQEKKDYNAQNYQSIR